MQKSIILIRDFRFIINKKIFKNVSKTEMLIKIELCTFAHINRPFFIIHAKIMKFRGFFLLAQIKEGFRITKN